MAKYLDNSGLARVWDKVKSHVSGQPFVRYDSQSLSDAYKLQARTNIDAAKSDAHTNPNLLDNAYFVGGGSQLGDGIFPINQRGQTSYTVTAVQLDRWHIFSYSGGIVMTLAAAGMNLHLGTNAGDEIAQIIPSNMVEVGETYTFSVQYQSGDIRTLTFVFSSSTIIESADQFRFHIIPSWGGGAFFGILNKGDAAARDLQLRAVKLEKGTVSTLANDPPPDFGEELRKCQRYFTRLQTGIQHSIFGTGVVEAGNIVACAFELPTVMRVSGTASAVVNNLYGYDGSNTYTVSGVYAFRQSGATPIASVWCGVTATAGTWLQIRGNDGSAYIDISADL